MRARHSRGWSHLSTARERRFWAGRRHNRGPLQGTNTAVPGPQILRTRGTPPLQLIQLERVGSLIKGPAATDATMPVNGIAMRLSMCRKVIYPSDATSASRCSYTSSGASEPPFRHIAWIDRSAGVERESGQSTFAGWEALPLLSR